MAAHILPPWSLGRSDFGAELASDSIGGVDRDGLSIKFQGEGAPFLAGEIVRDLPRQTATLCPFVSELFCGWHGRLA